MGAFIEPVVIVIAIGYQVGIVVYLLEPFFGEFVSIFFDEID
jgi:hypothetical protein